MLEHIFDSELGCEVYALAKSAVANYSMQDYIKGGVLVGLSGGADSVLLLAFLNRFKKEYSLDFKIAAFHLNHSIRGEEADQDEELSRKISNLLNIEFISRKIDVPSSAASLGMGIEETARKIRYECFENIIQGRNDIKSIAVAHNASDNLETVIFNMMRGAGLRGISGIPPIRDNIVRPLIYVPKKKIVTLLDKCGVPYAMDSTNASTEYSRNYIRHEIVPLLSRLSEEPEEMVTRLSENLRLDSDFIDKAAENAFSSAFVEGNLSLDEVDKLHPALFSRVIQLLAKSSDAPALKKKHIEAIRELLPTRHFRYSVGAGFEFVAEDRVVYIKRPQISEPFNFDLKLGENTFDGYSDIIYISYDKRDVFYPNVYKFSIQLSVNFDIINEAFSIRSRACGDSYRYGSMTRRLKKIFNDRDIPLSKRDTIPIFCINGDISYVPGFAVADKYKGKNKLFINVFQKKSEKKDLKSFFFPK